MKTSRICHSTGGNRVIKKSTQISAEPMICRGSRNFQLQVLVGIGFLKEPTDQFWAEILEKQQQRNKQK